MSTSQPPISNQKLAQNIVTLPRVTVQHDISTVIEDVRDGIVVNGWEDVWVSCYHDAKSSVHGKVRISRAHGDISASFEARDGIQWLGVSTGKKITAFDVSPDGTLYATGHADGTIHISSTGLTSNTTTATPTTTASKRPIGKPHLSTILSLKFFPSSTVLLSSSSDLSIRIHDANLNLSPTNTTTTTQPLNTVRTLQAHTAGVTCTAILDRGRNILSFGRDGSARLWDVGGGKEIVGRRWRAPKGTPILCGCVGETWQSSGHDSDGDAPLAEIGDAIPEVVLDGEVRTKGKVVFVGLHDGSVRGYELSTGHVRFFSSGGVDPSSSSINYKAAPIDSIAYSAERGVLVAGRRDGVVMFWDLTSDSPTSSLPIPSSHGIVQDDECNWRPSCSFRRNGAGVESLAFGRVIGLNDASSSSSPNRFPSILVGAEDGLFCRIGVDANGGPVLLEEFVGVEAGDGVRAVRALVLDGMEINWSAGDDGCVRRY